MNRKAKALEFANVAYDIQITGRHMAVSDAMKDYAMDKASKIERFTDRIIDVNVIMDIQKLAHRVEIILKAGHLKITSRASSTDMYVSIDQAVHKLEEQIRRYKSKIQDHHPKDQINKEEMVVTIVPPLDQEELDFEIEEEREQKLEDLFKPHQIVKRESVPLKTLTYEEAIMKMEFSNDPLSVDSILVFKNEEDQRIKILYRRKDGNYGIIEPSW